MKRLLKIEFHKIFYSSTFWVILGLYLVLMMPVALGFEQIITSSVISANGQEINSGSLLPEGFSIFNFPNVWLNITFLASWFKLLLVIIVVIFVCNEYQFKTLRQNIMDGMSKWEIIIAKELLILILSIVAAGILTAFILIFGKPQPEVDIMENSQVVVSYFIALLLYLNFAYFLSSWLKKSGLVIVILFLYTLIIENVISWKLPDHIAKFLPMNLIGEMIPNPFENFMGGSFDLSISPVNVLISFGYISVFVLLNYWMLKRGHAGKV